MTIGFISALTTLGSSCGPPCGGVGGINAATLGQSASATPIVTSAPSGPDIYLAT